MTPRRAAAALLAFTVVATVWTASPARAAAGDGKAWIDPWVGFDTSRNNVVTAGRCPAGANLIARLYGRGFPAAGQIVRGNTPTSHYRLTPAGGMVVPLLDTFQTFAAQQRPAARLGGTYRITVSCIQPLVPGASLAEYTGSFQFTSPTRYRALGPKPSAAQLYAEGAQPLASPGPSAVPADGANPGATTGPGGGFAAAPTAEPLAQTASAAGAGSGNGLLIGLAVVAVAIVVVAAVTVGRRRGRLSFGVESDED